MIADLAAQRAFDRLTRQGLDALSESERTVAAVWQFCSGVANSGFAGYYAGRRGDLAFAAPDALRAIGAHRLAAISAEANALFGPEGPPHDRDARQARLNALPERALATFARLEEHYYACEEEVDARLERYLTEAERARASQSHSRAD